MEKDLGEQKEDMGINFLVPIYPLNNIEITIYFHHESRFNSVFSRKNLPIVKDGAYVKNLNDKKSKGTL